MDIRGTDGRHLRDDRTMVFSLQIQDFVHRTSPYGQPLLKLYNLSSSMVIYVEEVLHSKWTRTNK